MCTGAGTGTLCIGYPVPWSLKEGWLVLGSCNVREDLEKGWWMVLYRGSSKGGKSGPVDALRYPSD